MRTNHKGWKKEPARHSLAARGLATKRRRYPSKAKAMPVEQTHVPADMKQAISKDIPFNTTMDHDDVSNMPSFEDRKWLREELQSLVEETLKDDLKPWLSKGWQVYVHRPTSERIDTKDELLFTGEIFLQSPKTRVSVPWNYYGYYITKEGDKWVGNDIGVAIAS